MSPYARKMRLTEIDALELVLTAGCNLRCSYCYQNDKKARSMEWSTLRASLDVLLRSSANDVQILFIGGEPLLEFPLIEQAVSYVAARRRAEMNVRYNIITNGILVTDAHVEFFRTHRFAVQLSFDGVPEVQDLRGRGTFGRLDALLDRLRAAAPEFVARQLAVSITLLPETLKWFPSSVAYFYEKGIEDLRISAALKQTGPWPVDRIEELDRVFSEVFDLSVRHYRRTGKVPLEVFWRRDEMDGTSTGEGPICAVGGARKLAVDVDGSALGCAAFATSYQTFPTVFLRSRIEALRLGHVDDARLADAFTRLADSARATGLFTDKGQKYSAYGRCGECRYLSSCSYCPVSIGQYGGNEDPRRVPDFLCAFNLVTNKYRERFPWMSPTMEAMLAMAPAPSIHPALQELFFGGA